MIDVGSDAVELGKDREPIPAYNGGLFALHDVDDIELPDEPWTRFFNSIGTYNFADEVNLGVLGHLFERSITELEKLKSRGILGDAEKAERYATMPQSAKRKQLGTYYTPSELTSLIVEFTVAELIDERFAELAVKYGVAKSDAARHVYPDDEAFWRGCLAILCKMKIVDPACGSGAFLFQAYNALEQRYHEVIGHLEHFEADDADELADQIPHFILNENLYGVDLSAEAVEITQLALWIRSATKGQTLATLSHNILQGNSLVHDPAVHPAGFNWSERFASVFERDERGFDCVIGNPPWERVKLQQREFFSLPSPEIAAATSAAKRKKLVAALEKSDPGLFEQYQTALKKAQELSDYCRSSGDFPLTSGGDTNTFAVFAELASRIVAKDGRVGFLVPSQIVFAKTYGRFFFDLLTTGRLRFFYDFENRLPKKERYFPDVDNRMKFGILGLSGPVEGRTEADFVFFAHRATELDDPKRHLILDAATIRHLNPATLTCPIFRTDRDGKIVARIYRQIPILKSKGKVTGNPWKITLKRKFDQDTKSDQFRDGAELQKEGLTLTENCWTGKEVRFIPLYEAKMVQAHACSARHLRLPSLTCAGDFDRAC